MITKFAAAFLGSALLFSLGLSAAGQQETGRAMRASAGRDAADRLSNEAQRALVKQYCVGCHSDQGRAGGLTLAAFDPAQVDRNAQVAEKMIRKLRAGMMPPPAASRRPDPAMVKAFVTTLETQLDEAAAKQPNPGRRPFQRLNRAEYTLAIRDLLGIDIDADAFLPSDTISSGFDNIADVQSLSPTLTMGHLRAAAQISRLAIGDRTATSTPTTYAIPRTEGQMRHVEGTPVGTRGGLSIVHTFPADGDYEFKVTFFGGGTGELFGGTTVTSTDVGEQIEISMNGERVALLDVDGWMAEWDKGMSLKTPPVHVAAGPQRISAAFIRRYAGPNDDLLAPPEITDADPRIGIGYGVTALPHLRELTITGPRKVTGVSETPSRRRIFSCYPPSSADGGASAFAKATADKKAAPLRSSAEETCANEIIKRLATQAYREPVRAEDFADLQRLYAQERAKNGFEAGVRLALQGILSNPRFLIRAEQTPAASLAAGDAYRINDSDLAARLSFFLWGTIPDDALMRAAARSTLRTPAVLEQQVRRLLADRRSEALSTRFARQWLRLQDVEKVTPEPIFFPHFDHFLGESYVRETTTFFDSLVRADRSVLELLTADYSFVNERIARQYGIANVVGNDFRRVALPPERRGLLGQGSILMLTSVADRTSPVLRGKWIMEVLLGSPPPPPPPNVPPFDNTDRAKEGRLLSTRERMEQHRANPACSSCHRMIDPPGLALENFDVTGQWRSKDNGVPIDAAGQLYDGTAMDGPAGLRAALLQHADLFVLSFTENLMTYALGRRVEYYDMPAIRKIAREAARQDYRISSFILGIVKSSAFQMSTADTAKTTAAGPASPAGGVTRR